MIDSSKEVNYEDPKFKTADLDRISKYKNIFAKGCNVNWSEEVFVIKKKFKTLFLGRYQTLLLMILMEKKLLEHFTETNWKKQIKKNLELKK